MSQASVDWGDGSAVEAVPVVGDANAWSFTGKLHTYAAPNTYTIKVTGLAGGVGTAQVVLPGSPILSGTPTTGLALTGQALSIPKPAGLVNGDYLLALIRGQVAAPVNDITPAIGFGRLGPNYVANDAGARVQGFFGKPIIDITREPANYPWTVPAAGRSLGILMILKGVGESQPGGYFPSYPGSGVAPHKFTDTFVLPTLPCLHCFGLGGEHSANVADTLSSSPAGMTLAQKALTDTVQTNSRTSLYLYTATRSVSPAPIADAVYSNAAVTTAGAQSIALRPPVPFRFANVTAALAKAKFTSAHRGNSVTYAEMSKDAYTQSTKRGYSVLEYSVARTSDGIWFGLHDQDINRTSGLAANTVPAASAMTWAQVQAYQNTLALDGFPQPYYRMDAFLTDFSPYILMIDPKYAWLVGGSVRTEFWQQIAGMPKERVIIKGYIDSVSLASAATANGYQSWGYAYEADVANASFPTWAAAWTILGLNLEAPQASWNTIKAYGKKVIGHIATSRSTFDMAVSKGADGVQVGATAQVPAVNAAP